jgi:hypothetical protein
VYFSYSTSVTGSFTISDSQITDNKAISTALAGGGGVYCSIETATGSFTMTNNQITDNRAEGLIGGLGTATAVGGGVSMSGAGTFTMKTGQISNNTAAATSNNNATAQGGGVFKSGTGTFTMEGGQITGNTATASGSGTNISQGGGVYKASGTFNITPPASSADIHGNTPDDVYPP